VSRYRGNADACPHCQLTYGRFRTGLTYRDVFVMLTPCGDHVTHRYRRRGSVLGFWFQLKRELWARHVDVECNQLVPF
jgi:hypothetical protein